MKANAHAAVGSLKVTLFIITVLASLLGCRSRVSAPERSERTPEVIIEINVHYDGVDDTIPVTLEGEKE